MAQATKGTEIFGVQFVSRTLLPERPIGSLRYPSVRFSSGEILEISLNIEIEGGPCALTFAQPWPQAPSIGAYQFVDPYADTRWPARVILKSRGETSQPASMSVAFTHEFLSGVRNILMDAFRNLEPFRTDQRLQTVGYRRVYYTHYLDAAGNPAPSGQWHLFPAEPLEPIGPGFVLVGGPKDRNHHSLVWSQAISFPGRSSLAVDEPQVRRRVQEIKRHWNSHQELADAERHAKRRDAKASVRSGAAAVEAAVKFYCTLWGLEFPCGPTTTFDEKIESVLGLAGRPSYRAISPNSSKSLLKLYRARSSMHEGDCYYNDPDTGERVDVKHSEACRLVEEAKRFVLWLDSLA
jgi:hypothetical protein